MDLGKAWIGIAIATLSGAACAPAGTTSLGGVANAGIEPLQVGALDAHASEARSPLTPDAPMTPSVVAASVAVARVDGRTRFVAGYRDGSTLLGDARATPATVSMAYAYSDDGVHWNRAAVLGSELSPVPIAAIHGAPALAAASDRPDVYYAAVASRAGDDPSARRVIAVAYSPDGGRTFLPPAMAAGSQIEAQFSTADAPSLAVDSGGRVHLVFVADQGTATANLQHWVGDRGGPACSYTCISWQPAEIMRAAPEDAPYLRHPVVRAFRRALYLAYEMRTPLARAVGNDDTALRVVLLRRNPLTSAWETTDQQPGGGNAVFLRARVPGTAGGQSADVGAAMDLALDPATGVGVVAWTGSSAGAADVVFTQQFRFLDVLSEEWSAEQVVSRDAAGGMAFQPTVSLAGAVRAVTWLQHDDASGRVRVMGARSENAGVSFGEPRSLSAIGGAPDASMPVCALGSHGWSLYGSSVTYDAGDAHSMTLTLHVEAAGEGCAEELGMSDRIAVGATRWGAGRE